LEFVKDFSSDLNPFLLKSVESSNWFQQEQRETNSR